MWGIHRDRWIPRTKGQLRGKCFHLMTSSCGIYCTYEGNPAVTSGSPHKGLVMRKVFPYHSVKVIHIPRVIILCFAVHSFIVDDSSSFISMCSLILKLIKIHTAALDALPFLQFYGKISLWLTFYTQAQHLGHYKDKYLEKHSRI